MYTLQGNTWPTRHTYSMLGSCLALDHMYVTWSAYSNLSWVINSVGQILLFMRKNAPNSTSQLSWVARRTRLSFSPNTTNEGVGLSQTSIDGRLLGLLGPYHQHVIGTLNTSSWGPTHWSLTDTGGGYNLGGASFPYHTPWPSQPTVLRFPPKGPAQSQVNNVTNTNWTRQEQTLNLTSGGLHSTSTAIYYLSIALLTVSHQEIGLTRINRKVNLNATTVPYNSYELNAQS
jgi:hypothetical protein